VVVIAEISCGQLSTIQLISSAVSHNIEKASMKASVTGRDNDPDRSIVEASVIISWISVIFGATLRA
jgi:hypothetical protein